MSANSGQTVTPSDAQSGSVYDRNVKDYGLYPGTHRTDAIINVQGAAVDLSRLTNRQDLEQIALKYQINVEGLTRTAIIRKIMHANHTSNPDTDPEPSKVIASVGANMRSAIFDVAKKMQLPVDGAHRESAFAVAKLIMEKTKNNGFGFTPTAHVTPKQAGAVDRRSVVQTAVQLGIPTEGRNRQEILTDILTVTLATKAQPLNEDVKYDVSNALQPSGVGSARPSRTYLDGRFGYAPMSVPLSASLRRLALGW